MNIMRTSLQTTCHHVWVTWKEALYRSRPQRLMNLKEAGSCFFAMESLTTNLSPDIFVYFAHVFERLTYLLAP